MYDLKGKKNEFLISIVDYVIDRRIKIKKWVGSWVEIGSFEFGFNFRSIEIELGIK